jgi:hypothetical protein
VGSRDHVVLDDIRWQRLATLLLSAADADVPAWTDQRDGDPGVTIVELFAFLGEQLATRAHALPANAREQLSAVAARLDSVVEPADQGVSVHVEGERWHRVASLADCAPGDHAYVVSDDGRVSFGDGEHGRRPAAGAHVFVSWRSGGGEAGRARVSLTARWPPTPSQYLIAFEALGMHVTTLAGGAEQFTGDKRVRYFDGQLLSARDFRDEQQYLLDMRRLHNRLLHGSGIVSGLRVTTGSSSDAIVVDPGLALDPQGREVRLHEPVTLTSSSAVPQFVIVRYVERCTDPVPVAGGVSGEPSRIEEGAAVLLAAQEIADGVAVARVLSRNGAAVVDTTFEPKKARS